MDQRLPVAGAGTAVGGLHKQVCFSSTEETWFVSGGGGVEAGSDPKHQMMADLSLEEGFVAILPRIYISGTFDDDLRKVIRTGPLRDPVTVPSSTP